MKSIGFPKMLNKNSIRYKKDRDATLQNLKTLLQCEQGEMLDDPYFGINIKKYLFDQNNIILKDVLIDEIYNQIAAFMPQLKVDRRDIKITQDGSTLYANIKVLNKINFTNDMYNIVLFQGDNQ